MENAEHLTMLSPPLQISMCLLVFVLDLSLHRFSLDKINLATFQKSFIVKEKTVNCWEFKGCGRELDGKNVSLYGLCPAAVDSTLDGIHGGKNGGRCCWVVKAVYNKNKKFGCRCTVDYTECHECNFYKLVQETTKLIVTA